MPKIGIFVSNEVKKYIFTLLRFFLNGCIAVKSMCSCIFEFCAHIMDRKRHSKYNALNEFVQTSNCLSVVDDTTYFCKYCCKEYKYDANDGKRQLKRHINSKNHIKAEESKSVQQKLEYEIITEKIDPFDTDIVKLFLNTGIPLQKTDNKDVQNFFKKYTGRNLKSTKHYRTVVVDKLYCEQFDEILGSFKNVDYYIIFDETTDIKGRYILNILAGLCSNTTPSSAKLLRMIELNKTNADTVMAEIMNVVTALCEGNLMGSKLKLVVSDMAAYALKAGRMLKQILPNIKHVTCLAHMLHLLCETLRKNLPLSDNLFAKLKHMLNKNKNNQQLFYAETNLKIPKFPVITRWGTWIEFGCFIFENYKKIMDFLKVIDEQDRCREFESIYNNSSLYDELNAIKSHQFLVTLIKKLESDTLTTNEQIQIIKTTNLQISGHLILAEKMKSLIIKNPDLSHFLEANPEKQEIGDGYFEYLQLTTVAVERSFSALTYILNDKRTNLTVENLEKLLFLYFNK